LHIVRTDSVLLAERPFIGFAMVFEHFRHCAELRVALYF